MENPDVRWKQRFRNFSASVDNLREALVLFGSRAKGTWREGSDIDLAVFGRDLNRSDVWTWKDELEADVFPWAGRGLAAAARPCIPGRSILSTSTSTATGTCASTSIGWDCRCAGAREVIGPNRVRPAGSYHLLPNYVVDAFSPVRTNVGTVNVLLVQHS